LCRIILLFELPEENNTEILKKLVETCSVKEQEDFYKNLFFLETAKAQTSLFEEGIRTNAETVFDSIALNNPYPANYLSENAWSQLVLKAIFMGRPLYKIYNLNDRSSQNLALILNDYIHERWSAGRTVSPEIWQLMIGYDHPELKATLQKAKGSTDKLENKAAEIVLQHTENKTINNHDWIEIGKQFNQIK